MRLLSITLVALSLLQVAFCTLDPSLVLTNPVRSEHVMKYCKGPRSGLVRKDDLSSATSYGSIVNVSFGIDPIKFVQNISKINSSNILEYSGEVVTGVALTSGPFILGTILSLFLWAFLLCCCVCPSCCPPTCCQHPNNKIYSRCELVWPAVVMLAAVVMACGASIAGVMESSKISAGIESFECAYSITLDDLMNGNITSDKTSFFAGGAMLVKYLNYLSGNISRLVTNLSVSTEQGFKAALSSASTSQAQLEYLPNTTTANASFVLDYIDPTPLSETQESVRSEFGSALGTCNQNNTMCGNLCNSVLHFSSNFSQTYGQVIGLKTLAPYIQNQSASMATSINTSLYSVQLTDNESNKLFDGIEQYKAPIGLAMTIYHGVVIGLCGLALVFTAVAVFLKKPDCRYALYGACAGMAIMVIVGMLVALVLSVVMPATYITCSVANAGLSSPQDFVNFLKVFNMSGQETKGLSQCVPGGTGSFLTGMGTQGAQLQLQLDMFLQAMQDVKSSSAYSFNSLQNSQDQMTSSTEAFISAAQNDIKSDPVSRTWFRAVANGSIPDSCYSNPTFLADSLVPSLNPVSLALFPCDSSTQPVACDDFATCASGCIDMYDVMVKSGSSAAFLQKISQRYSATPACVSDLSAMFSINYNNWFVPRTDPNSGITQVKNRWLTAVSPKIDELLANAQPLKQQLAAQYSTINATIPQAIDPVYGMIAGTNCLTMGEDIVLLKNTVCVNIFNHLYVGLVTVGISAFGLMLAMCCIVCTGVRQYKQIELYKGKLRWEETVRQQRQRHPHDGYHAINYPEP